MSGILDQLPTLLGVVVGGLMSYVVGALAERSRWRRQQEIRWDSQLLQAYSEYGYAVKECATRYQRLAAHRGLTNHPAPVEPTEAELEQAANAEGRRAAMVEGLTLLTNAATAEAVQKLNRCVWHLEWLARGQLAGTPSSWALAFNDYRAARAEFYQHARRSLQIAELGPVREAPWPPPWRPAQEPSDP
ncbi:MULTISPECIES: hypothetical protein [unclassified Streptomyces]|uniref:hypothetical protein n=1 Tax=unclassified Streptomyces TaxID=2593676 RepID=UPI0023665AB8|nr:MULTISPECIES: hypothetical protein [unclassified Streptomyces]MDF3142944.1 hypothetical protein [Streptomyces sp. T21Q-yed]WDF40013.1 hypothetical protein PBV52_26130 [Streptomyces sp. T12]